MAGEVDSVGKGFFTEAGELKSKSQLAKESQNPTSKTSEDKVELSSNEDKFIKSVADVKGRFRQDVNSISDTINQGEANLKEAAKAVKEQLEAAKKLKLALKEGDKKEVQQAQIKYEAAANKRNEVAAEIRKDNQANVDKRAKSINLGNQQLGIVKVKAVELDKRAAQAPETVDQVAQEINELKVDRQKINAQRKDLSEVKRELKKVVDSAEQGLSKLEQGSVRDLRQAEEIAAKLSNRIVNNASQALASNKISEEVVRQLLQ